MIYTALINQKAAIDSGLKLDLESMFVFSCMLQMTNAPSFQKRAVKHEGNVYFEFKYSMLAEQMPLLFTRNASTSELAVKRVLRGLIAKIVENGLMKSHPDNVKLSKNYMCFTDLVNQFIYNKDKQEVKTPYQNCNAAPYQKRNGDRTESVTVDRTESVTVTVPVSVRNNSNKNKSIINESINTHNSENLQFSDVYEPSDFQNKKQSSAARHHEKLGGNDIQILGRERAEMKKIIQSTIEQENKRYNKVWAVMYENLSKKDSENFMELQRLFIELEPDAELRLLTFQKYLEACYEKLAKEFKPKEPQVFSISWILGVYNLVAPILKRKATEQNEKAAAAAETQEKLNEFMRMYAEPEPQPEPEKPAERRKREYYQTGEDGKIRIVTEYLD
jgi:hypothetical protein